MPRSQSLLAGRRCLCMAVAMFAGVALASVTRAEEALTLKERLSDKASDAQRVDNCHVPPERRGTQPRPDCAEKPRPASAEAKAPR